MSAKKRKAPGKAKSKAKAKPRPTPKVKRPVRPPARTSIISRESKPVIPVPDDLAPLGAHISTSGGVTLAPFRGDEIGATAMQIFTKTPNQWKEKVIPEAEAAAYDTALAASGSRFVNAHDSYLINLASPDAVLRARSLDSFILELRRCHALGLDALVSHPGNFIDDRASGLARNADAIIEALEAAPGPTRLLMELTAGQGTVLGSTFEEMAELLGRLPVPLQSRVGVCLDTAHICGSGYDLATDYDGVWSRFADHLGHARLGMLHLNDSAAPVGSRKDRHALIGDGHVGDAAFRRIMTDPRLAAVPKVIETPKGDDMVTNDRRMLKKLRAFAKG